MWVIADTVLNFIKHLCCLLMGKVIYCDRIFVVMIELFVLTLSNYVARASPCSEVGLLVDIGH